MLMPQKIRTPILESTMQSLPYRAAEMSSSASAAIYGGDSWKNDCFNYCDCYRSRYCSFTYWNGWYGTNVRFEAWAQGQCCLRSYRKHEPNYWVAKVTYANTGDSRQAKAGSKGRLALPAQCSS